MAALQEAEASLQLEVQGRAAPVREGRPARAERPAQVA